MRLSRLMKWIGFCTFIALIYIHMQMKIIHLAYQGKNKEKTIRSLSEDNGYLTYEILMMKSASNLGVKMLSEKSKMDFVDPNNVMFMSTPQEAAEEEVAAVAQHEPGKPTSFMSLLSFGAQAEAQGLE